MASVADTRPAAPPARPVWRLRAMNWHQALAIVGGAALLLWGISGLLHITMSSFGPQSAVFLPPQRGLDLSTARPLHDTLAAAGIRNAAAIKIVVGEQENLLQVTETADAPRRYFRLADGTELPGEDARHAAFLARHYAGLPDTPILGVERITEFSDAYPSVNRLLPAWLVRFDRPDGLAYYIHTETGAVASVVDSRKALIQQLFQTLHSWNWLKGKTEWLRVLIIGVLVGSLFSLVVSGISMLVLIRRRASGRRLWHRRAGLVLAVPLLFFSASGLYHLVQNGWATPTRTLRLSPPLRVPESGYPLTRAWRALAEGRQITGVSLVQTQEGRTLYRLSLAMNAASAPRDAGAIRNARFQGAPTSLPPLYLDALTGRAWAPGDREMAMQLGGRFTGLDRSHVREARLITGFGPGYDFRNKRLPVWALDYGPPLNATLFVDPATGVLADRTANSQKIENWSFSLLHKWNMLRPFGMIAQNAIIATMVLACLTFMAGIGLSIRSQRKRPVKRAR
ncbi:PepSY domain-containing protein [Polymorphobacter sp.]|uniref:PepSY domain-containing protein n=1 Tax=Polymorphobacter sp. TaxID=1909290 RepID=UPI003F6F9AE8